MPASDYQAQAELNVERGTTYTAPANRYFALLTDVPDGTTADALAKELTAGAVGYARVAVPGDTSHWTSPSQPGGAGTPWQISNVNAISWGSAGSAWGAIAAFAEFDSATLGAGNFIRYWKLTPLLNVVSGQTVQVAAGAALIEKAVS